MADAGGGRLGRAVATVKFNLAAKLVMGEHGNVGRAALMWGPMCWLTIRQEQGPAAPQFLGLAEAASRRPAL